MQTLEDFKDFIEKNSEKTVFKTLGIQVSSYDKDAFSVTMPVEERHMQHAGICHGGVYVLLAESVASMAARVRTLGTDMGIFGLEINANHLRPSVIGDTLSATATCEHAGRTTMVFTIKVNNQNQKTVSLARCTIALRPSTRT